RFVPNADGSITINHNGQAYRQGPDGNFQRVEGAGTPSTVQRFDASGNHLGATTTDGRGRVTESTTVRNGFIQSRETTAYNADNTSVVTRRNGEGRELSRTTLDAQGRRTEHVRAGPPEQRTSYTYNADGTSTSRTMEGGRQVRTAIHD